MIKIVLIDDENSAFYHFLDKVIASSDIQYHFLKDNIKEIFSYLDNNKVDAIFLDVKMPSINGIDLAELILDRYPTLKIVFITGLNIKLEDLPIKIQDHVLGISYKPINEDDLRRYFNLINNKKNTIRVSMFNVYDCFLNDKLIKFSSRKSKELFALLVVNRGKTVTMEHAITYLWPDKDIDKSKILYRDAVWRLRQNLEELKIPCVEFARASLTLDPTYIESDYYDYLDGKKIDYDKSKFLIEYDWGSDLL